MPFRQLRWKLTFAYTLVTVTAVLVLEVAGLCALFVLFSSPPVPADLVQEAAATLAEEMHPFLSTTPPDRAGLQFWLRQMLPPLTLSRSAPDIDLDTDLGVAGSQTSFTFGESDQMAVLGPSGELAGGPARHGHRRRGGLRRGSGPVGC